MQGVRSPMIGIKAGEPKADIEQVRIEKKLYTLPCRSDRLVTMQ